jgi:hypothetical protein
MAAVVPVGFKVVPCLEKVDGQAQARGTYGILVGSGVALLWIPPRTRGDDIRLSRLPGTVAGIFLVVPQLLEVDNRAAGSMDSDRTRENDARENQRIPPEVPHQGQLQRDALCDHRTATYVGNFAPIDPAGVCGLATPDYCDI